MINFSSFIKQKISILILGILAGFLISSIYFSNQLEELYWEKQNLKHDLTQSRERADMLEQEIEIMEEEWGTLASPTIKEVNIFVDYEESQQTQLSIKEYCQEITKDLVGHNLDNLEPELIMQMLEKRVVDVNDNRYELSVKSLLISEDLKFWIVPEKVAEQPQ